jgi:hypothetical protein
MWSSFFQTWHPDRAERIARIDAEKLTISTEAQAAQCVSGAVGASAERVAGR